MEIPWVGVGGCMRKSSCKNEEHLPFCREFSILCIEDRVAVDSAI